MYKTLLTIAVLFAYTGIFGQRTTLPNTATQSPSNKNLNNVNGQLIQNRLVVNDSAWFNGVQNLFPNGQVGIGTVTPTAKLHVVSDSNLIRMVATFGSEIISILGGKNIDGTILNGFLVNHTDGDDAASCLIGYNSNGDLTSRLFYESDTGANASVNALYGQILIEVNDDGGNNVILSVTDPEGVVIQGKNTSSLASALTVRQGDGTEVLEVRNDGRVTLGSTLASTNNILVIGENTNKRILMYSDSNGVGIEGDSNFIVISSDSIILGRKYGASGVTSAIVRAEASSGSNQSGGTLYFKGAAATGNSTSGGYIQFGTSDAGASGATQQPISEKVRITKTGDVVIFPSTKGVVMFDGTNYWRLTNTAGVASFVNIGSTIPN